MSISKGVTHPSAAVSHRILHLELERVLLLASLDIAPGRGPVSAEMPARERRGARRWLRNLALIALAILAASLTISA